MRDLERAEIAKAALQTDEVETQLTKMKKEYMAYKGQSQDQMKELQSALLKGTLVKRKAFFVRMINNILNLFFFLLFSRRRTQGIET